MLAFLASLAIHALFLFGMPFVLPMPPESKPLQVEMKPMPKARAGEFPISQPPSKLQPARQSSRKTPRHRVARGKKSAVSTAPALIAPESARAVPTRPPMAEERGTSAEVRNAAETMDNVDEADLGATASGDGGEMGSPDAQDAVTMRGLPPRGRIVYRVDRGDREFEIGRAISEWEVAEGRYVLRLQMETTGLVWLFKSYRIDMESRGWLTAVGLRPERFTIRRNGGTAKEHAEFDWSQMRLSVADKPPQPLDPGAQDLLSFNFHLGFMPDPKLATRLPIATGKKYAIYPLDAVGDEEIELPMGRVHTLHVRSAGEQTTELWLAYDYFLLPVKIRHVDRQGSSFVQVATNIQVDAGAQ